MVGEFLIRVSLGICVKCFQEFLINISLDSGTNLYFLSQTEASGWGEEAQTVSFWLHSAEILYPGCEFLFPQASTMFAQCPWPWVSPVLLIALLCCILSPPAQAIKVSEQIQTQALKHVCRCVFILCRGVDVYDGDLCFPLCFGVGILKFV